MNPSNNSWTSYDVPLNDLSGWHVAALSGALAAQAQIQTTLANITDLEIRAEYQIGPDRDSLDNVFLFSLAVIDTRRWFDHFIAWFGSVGTRAPAAATCLELMA